MTFVDGARQEEYGWRCSCGDPVAGGNNGCCNVGYGGCDEFCASPVADWTSESAIDALEAFIDFALENTNGPIYVHCGTGFASSAALQMLRLRRAAKGESVEMTVQGAIDEVAVHGFDISTNADVVAALFREAGTTAAAVTAPTEDGTTEINLYHWMKYLGAFGEVKMFDAGQIHAAHIAAAKAAGIKVVVNMRKAVTSPLPADNGKNSQEETNLLNLGTSAKTSTPAVLGGVSEAKCFDTWNGVETVAADATACAAVDTSTATACEAVLTAAADDAADAKACTYAAAVDIPVVARTDSANILQYYPQWVTESTRPTSWVDNGIHNFEGENALEFGDAIGYNADLEKAAWEAAGITYVHIPIGHGGSGDYSAAKLLESHVAMMGAITTAQAASGHVLWHCRTGYRTGAFPSALFSVIRGDGADAVGARMAKLGYDYAGNLKNLIDDAAANLECADCKCDGTAACTGTFKMKVVALALPALASGATCSQAVCCTAMCVTSPPPLATRSMCLRVPCSLAVYIL
jgi:protein tyrosine phosphatase (PTP) superfamily phosphohydrolase (DUF442 family)